MNDNLKDVELTEYNSQVEKEAKILLNHALMLSKAFDSGKEDDLLYALDSNLKLWVEIETGVKSKDNTLPKNAKDNLLKLCTYVERVILAKGLNITKEDINSIVNANTQVSNGILEQANNLNAFENAISLLNCAINLSNAQDKKDVNAIVSALDENMKLWVYIKTMVSRKDSKFSKDSRDNLIKLADYVSAKTLEIGRDISNLDAKAIDSMVMTNLQISEGLVEKRVA